MRRPATDCNTETTIDTKNITAYILDMKKPLSPDDPVIRKTVAIPSSIWRRIASFRFANEIPTEVEAVRRVMDAGLDVLAPAKTKRRATPAGEP